MENTKSAKITIALSIIAVLFAVAGFIISLVGIKPTAEVAVLDDETATHNDAAPTSELRNVAYIDLDTLLVGYLYSAKLNEDLKTEQIKAQANLEARMHAFEKKYNEFTEKARLGSFLSQASMESQQNDLVKEQAAIEKLQSDLTEQLITKQNALNAEIYDTIVNYVKEYSETKGDYVLVLGDNAGSTVLYAQPGMNITRIIVDNLNKRYKNE